MIKPVRWNTFIRDFIRIQIGFILFGLAITLMIRGNLGTSAWAVLEVALAPKLQISIGTMTVVMGFMVLSGALLMRERLGWGTLANILSIGPWEDFWLKIIPSVKENLFLQSGMLLLAIFLMASPIARRAREAGRRAPGSVLRAVRRDQEGRAGDDPAEAVDGGVGARRGVVARRELIDLGPNMTIRKQDGHGDLPPWITGAPVWVEVAMGVAAGAAACQLVHALRSGRARFSMTTSPGPQKRDPSRITFTEVGGQRIEAADRAADHHPLS